MIEVLKKLGFIANDISNATKLVYTKDDLNIEVSFPSSHNVRLSVTSDEILKHKGEAKHSTVFEYSEYTSVHFKIMTIIDSALTGMSYLHLLYDNTENGLETPNWVPEIIL